MAKILLEIEGRDDGATKVLRDAEDAAKSLTDAVGGQSQINKTSSMSWTELKSSVDLATMGVQAFAQAAKDVYEFGKAGAVVKQTSDSFDGLIEKVGASSDLLQQLRDASVGTVDDMTLMSSTITLVAGAEDELATSLTNTTPQLLEIAKAANKLNPQLGDTAYLYESIATGVKRASPQILDNLGLTIRVGEANEKYAAQLGKSSKELTAVEQKQALLNATLEAGKVLIEQAGGSAGSATDNFSRLETSLKNLGDQAKEQTAPAIGAVVGALADMLELSVKNQGTLEGITGGYGRQAAAARDATIATIGMTDAEERARDAAQRNSQVVEQQAPIIQQDADSTWDLQNALAISADAQSEFDARTAATNSRLEAQAALADELTSAQEKLANAEASWAEKAGADVQRMLEQKGLTAEKYAEGLGAIDEAAGTSFSTENELAIKQQELVDKFAAGKITAEEFATGLETLEGMFMPLNEGIQEASRLVEELQTQVNELTSRTYNVVIRAVVSGDIGSAVAGAASAGAEAVNNSGERVGGEREYGSGGTFVIPSGYEDHTWPVGPGRWAASGERVTISPDANQTGNVTFENGAIMIQGGNADASQIADMVIQRINQRFKAARFGGGYAGAG